MCELFENYAKKRAKESAVEIVRLLIKNGVDFEVVKKSVVLVLEEEIEAIYNEVCA